MCPADSRGEELDLIVITKKRKEYHVETFSAGVPGCVGHFE